MEYLSILVSSLKDLTDFVLIYEHCHCIHEMVKELDNWGKKGEKDKYHVGSFTKSFMLNESSGHDEED